MIVTRFHVDHRHIVMRAEVEVVTVLSFVFKLSVTRCIRYPGKSAKKILKLFCKLKSPCEGPESSL